jgi:hypothetical protein
MKEPYNNLVAEDYYDGLQNTRKGFLCRGVASSSK